MNAERLRGVVEFILGIESKNDIQGVLNQLNTAVSNLVGSPADQTHQNAVANAHSALETAINTLTDSLSPADQKNIMELTGYEFFSRQILLELSKSLSTSGMTPVVLQQQLQKLIKARQKYIETLKNLAVSLNAVGVKTQTLSPGQAEIGILIPRDIFKNNLDGFQKELKTLNSIVRTFYEVSNVTPGAVEIRQISTSDPILFLGMDITVLVHFGHAVKWAVDTIKATMEVKKVVDMARSALFDESAVSILQTQIDARVDKCIDEKVAAILANYEGAKERKNELESPLKTSLEQILQRVERGMTVEIRFLPPPQAPKTEGSTQANAEQAKFEELKEIAKNLDFPQIPPGEPMLQLTVDDKK